MLGALGVWEWEALGYDLNMDGYVYNADHIMKS